VLRRALALTVIAVAFSAAGAFAFSPRLVYFWRTVGRGGNGLDRAYTPVPSTDSLLYQTQGGVPGTYCPIPARGAEKPMAMPLPTGITEAPRMSPAAPAAVQSSDPLLPGLPATCVIPPTAPSARPIVP